MFYSQCLVSRKGPLGAIWIAAYFFKKLKKAQVKATHIPSSIDQILQKELDALTYRVLAYLLLGIVRIYSKKVDFLFDDCNKALIGVKEFVAKERNKGKTAVPLPESSGCFSIALPDRFELDAFDLGILEDFYGGNVKPQEDITLKDGSRETYCTDLFSMERFDVEEDLLFTFQETFSADCNETKHERFTLDMDIDTENVRDTTEEASVRVVVEAEPLDSNESSRDNQIASRHRVDLESDDMLVELQMSEDIRRAQEEDAVSETIGIIVQRLVGPQGFSGDKLPRDEHRDDSESEDTLVETSRGKMRYDGSLISEYGSPGATQGIEVKTSGAARIDGEKEIPEMSILEESEPETSKEKMRHDGSFISECGSPGATQGIEVKTPGAARVDGEKEIPEMSTLEESEPETSKEMMRHDGSFISKCGSPGATQGIEVKTFGAARVDGEKEIPEISTLEESEPGSVTNFRDFPEGVEKCRGHSEVEITDFKMFHMSRKEQSEVPEVNINDSEKGFLSDMPVSEDPNRGFNATDTPVSVTPKTPLQLKINKEETSPQFSVIPTPAAKESSRVSRKRKCLIDNEVLIPNKVMKKMIEDSSDLISKRRIPHSDCPEKRTKRFANPSRIFLDPLIPYGSVELKSFFCQPIKLKNWGTTAAPKDAKIAEQKEKSSLGNIRNPRDILSSDKTENAQKMMETPQPAAPSGLKVIVGNSNEVSVEMEASSINYETAHLTENAAQTPVKPPETPVRTSEQTQIAPETPVVSEQVGIAPETPVRESMSIRFFKEPETCEKETRSASCFTSFDEHPSDFCVENRDLDAILINEEVHVDEREDLQQERWSARTRNVAKFLEKTFLEQREREEEEKVSLLQLCRGRTQKESARLFYETLVLKTKGYLEVKQDQPYSDVLLKRFVSQQKAC